MMQRFVFVYVLVLCFISFITFSKGRYVIFENKTMEVLTSAEETQHAVCKIVTKELQATANVTLTRELKGVCTSSEVNLKLEEMQRVLLKELHLIRQELIGDDEEILKEDKRHLFQNVPQELNMHLQKLSSLQKRTAQNNEAEARKEEILKYNTTINSSINGMFFYYYWKLENINEILSDQRGISVRSPSFSLLGRSFHIVLFPHHMTSKYVGIQLKAPRGYFLKHRFTIIDHVSVKGDLSSQLLGDERNYAVMYRVAHDRIESVNFINGDVLIIKISINLK